MRTLGWATHRHDARADRGHIWARVLSVVSRTDALFPPSLAQEVMPALAAAGADLRYAEIDTEHGHRGSNVDVARLSSFQQNSFRLRSSAGRSR